MRLFIAIMLSDDMKKAVTGTMHELKKADVRGSYVPAQNLHVTLAFIGETKDASSVKTAMQTLSCKPFRMAFAEMGVFDNLLWVGIKGNQGLNKLAKYVGTALDEAQIPCAARNDHPQHGRPLEKSLSAQGRHDCQEGFPHEIRTEEWEAGIYRDLLGRSGRQGLTL